MKRRHLLLVALSLIISICMCFALSACSSCDDDKTPTQLTTPVVTINDAGVASWGAVENASGYAYKIDDGTVVETTELSRQLSDGQNIAVKAIGDGKNYSDSGWSEAETYTAPTVTPQPVTLGKPVVTIADDGTASWTAIENATKYTVKIGTTETDQTATSVKLENGQSIQVKAVGNGTTYLTGEWSDVKTYTVGGGDEHHHNYVWTPNSDGTTHNGHCDVDGCDEPDITNENHVYDNDADTTCNKCDYVREIGGNEPNDHTHDYVWTPNSDGTTHNGHCGVDGCDTPDITNENHVYDNDADTTCNKCGDIRDIGGDNPAPSDVLTAETTIKAYAEAQDPKWEKGTKYESINLNANITVTAKGGSNTSKYYDSNGGDWRFYQSETPLLTISAKEGFSIVSVTITYNSDKGGAFIQCDEQRNPVGNKLEAPTVSIENINSDKLLLTVVNTGDANNGRADITAVKVTYKKVAIELKAPEVTVDDYGVVTWKPVTNADSYAYSVDGGATVSVAKTDELKYDKLTNGQTINVWAVGDGTEYKDSKPATGEYTQSPLVMTAVSVDEGGLAKWDKVDNASGYKYILLDKDNNKVGEGDLDKDTCFKQLGDGQKIRVMAVGEGKFISSDYSDASEIFTAPQQKDVCDIPEISIARCGKVTIAGVEGAASYKYIITTSEGEQSPVDVTNLTTLDLELQNGQTIKVMAVGNDITHTSSEYTAIPVEYKAPSTTLDAPANLEVDVAAAAGKVTVSFAKVDSAKGYAYTIDSDNAADAVTATVSVNGEIVSFTIDLEVGKVIRVMALGDEEDAFTPETAGDYSSRTDSSSLSDPVTFTIDDTKTYSVSEILDIIAYYNSTEDSEKAFKVTGVVSANTAYYASSNSVTITLADKNDSSKTISLYAAKVPVGFEKTAENVLVDAEIVATGKVKLFKSAAQLSSPEVKIDMTDEDRFLLAVLALLDLKANLEKDITENITLPVTLFGAKVTWSIDELDADKKAAAEAAFDINNDTGIATVTRKDTDIAFTLKAELDVDGNKYEATDSELSFSIKVPADTGEIKISYDFNKSTGIFKDAIENVETADLNTEINKISDAVQFTFDKNTSSLTPKYHKDGYVQFYAANTLIISAGEQKAIIQIDITYNGTATKIGADKGEFSEQFTKWTGFVTDSLKITNNQTGQVKISKITVTCLKLTDDTIVKSAAKNLTLEKEYKAGFTLPVTGDYGTTVSWEIKSSDAGEHFTLGDDKKTVTIIQCETAHTVVLTATVAILGDGDVVKASTTKDITITIPAQTTAGGTTDPDPVAIKTLSFESMSSVASKGTNGYSDTWTATINSFVWNIYAFHNNNKGWSYIKAGQKSTAYKATISTASPIENKIKSVVVTIDAVTVAKVNSIKLIVSENADFSNPIETISADTIATGEITFNLTSPEKNYYYQLLFDMQSGTNGTIQVSKVVYNGYAT